MPPRRALLYVPGSDLHKLKKAAGLPVDCVCLDLEDGVAANRKEEARQAVPRALKGLEFGATERLVRINPASTGLMETDLGAVLASRPNGIVIPKVDNDQQVRMVSGKIAEAETRHGWPTGGIRLLAQVESALAIVNLERIASADNRLDALIFGADDFASNIGATRTSNAWEVFYARSAVVTHCAAFGLQAIDMVYIDLANLEGLASEAARGAMLGFEGKQIIHPNQIAPVQQAFSPSPEAIAQATRLLEAYRQHQGEGVGAFVFDGRMIDEPTVKNARRIIARARSTVQAGQTP